MKNKALLNILVLPILFITITACSAAQNTPLLESSPLPPKEAAPQTTVPGYPPGNEGGGEGDAPGYPLETPQKQLTAQPDEPYPSPVRKAPTIALDNLQSLMIERTLPLEQASRLVWSLDQKFIAVISYDQLKIYNYPDLDLLYEYMYSEDEAFVNISPEDLIIAVTENNENIVLVNWQTGERREVSFEFPFMGGEFSPDGEQLMLHRMDRIAVSIIDLDTGTERVYEGFETAAPVYSARFGTDGNHIIWHARATLQLTSLETGEMGPAIYHEDFVADFGLNPQGNILVSSAGAMQAEEFVPFVFFWNTETGELIDQIVLPQPAYSMDFSTNGDILAVSDGSDIILISMATLEIYDQIPTDQENISQLVFSPDGTILTSVASDPPLIQFWRVR